MTQFFLNRRSIGLFFTLLLCSNTVFAEDKPDATSYPSDPETITGAGAHFAWVIFDSLKDEIEAKTGKKMQLFGKN